MRWLVLAAFLAGCGLDQPPEPPKTKIVVVPPKIVEVPVVRSHNTCRIIPLTLGEAAESPSLAGKVAEANQQCAAANPRATAKPRVKKRRATKKP